MKTFSPKPTVNNGDHPSVAVSAVVSCFLKQCRLLVIFLAMALPLKSFAQAPTLSYSSPETYVIGTAITTLAPASSGVAAAGYRNSSVTIRSGFNRPNSIAVDAAGNVYLTDQANNLIKEIPIGGGATVTLGSGFSFPIGVAVDALGNVYVADNGNSAVKEIPVGNGSPVTLGSDFNSPVGVAVDALGNVYVADYGNKAIKKIPVGDGAPVTLASGFGSIYGVAVDARGNVYGVDYFNNDVTKIPAGGGAASIIGSGYNNPTGIAVDDAGNVFVADNLDNEVKEIPVGGTASITIGSGFLSPYGVAVDAAGNVYVADYSNNAVKEIIPTGGYYISSALPAGLNFDNATGIISGTPTALSPATNYTITAYNSSGSSTSANVTIGVKALAITYSSPQTYTADIAITPLSPAVTGVVAAPAYSNSQVALNTALISAAGVAADGKGNIYVADKFLGSGVIETIPANGGGLSIKATGFSTPVGVALDAKGNLYVADSGIGYIKMIAPGGGASVAIGSGFSGPTGVAVDSSGNVYVADYGNNAIKKVPAGNGAPIVIGSGFNAPKGVAVDALGNVYVADYGNNAVKMIPVGGGAIVSMGSGFSKPTGVAVDASGNVFVTDNGNHAVKEIPTGGGSPVTIGSAIMSPYGVTTDFAGNVYVADNIGNSVLKIKPVGGYYISRPLPAGLSLAPATGVVSGTPTAAIPATTFTITAYNPAGSNSATVNIMVNLPPLPVISYSGPQAYLVGTAITALSPTGSGVAPAGYSSSPVIIRSGFKYPAGVAVDAAGDVYVADESNNAVTEIPVGGGTPISLGSGFNAPEGVAVDAAGNVYVAANAGGVVEKIPAGSGSQVGIGSGFNWLRGIAVDALGNVYVTDNSIGTPPIPSTFSVKEIPIAGGSPVILSTASNELVGVAVDAAGNVYVANAGGTVDKVPPGGASPVTLGSGFSEPEGVAVDAAGNVYVADYGNSAVKEIPAGGGTLISVGSGFNEPTSVAVDGAGNVYVGDSGSGTVKETKPVGGYYISAALPAGLSFNSVTGVISGTPTAVSPATNYTITAYNRGGNNSAVVNIKVSLSAVATLSNLAISTGTLKPVFVSGTTAYTTNVDNGITSITLTPTETGPGATIKVNGAVVASGAASAVIPLIVGPNTITTVVTAQDGVTTQTYTVTVTRAPSNNANLSTLGQSASGLTPSFSPATTSYTINVGNAVATMTLKPVSSNASSTIKVNGTAVTTGTMTAPITLAEGTQTTITTVVTAQNGATTKTYTLTVTRAPSTNANLSKLGPSVSGLTPSFSGGTTSYTLSVSNATASMTLTPVSSDANATIKVNGTSVTSGTVTAPIALTEGGQTVINTVVTAQNGTTTKTYTVTVTRAPSTNADLSKLGPSIGGLTPAFISTTTSYTISTGNATASIKLTPVSSDANATIKVNGTAIASGTTTAPIALAVGPNTITTVVTAQDGTTTKTYTLTVTRAASGADGYVPIAIGTGISVTIPIAIGTAETPTLADDGIQVHQGVSPNGDGINDFLQIDNISQYPDNKLMIMDRNGQLIYEAKGYDNSSKVFDGHSNKNGQMQLPGTYFYQLDYIANGVTKHKTGFLVLKY